MSQRHLLRGRSDEWAVVTGATSGIGAAFAKALASLGYNLIITGRRKVELSAVAADCLANQDVQVKAELAELSHEPDIKRLESLIAAVPDIAVLVNNAGFGMAGAFTEYPDKNDQMLKVHVLSPLRLIQAVVPAMKTLGRGTIINVSSVAAFFPMPEGATYSATKGYLNTFSESLHMELARFGISVQALCPGMTRTDFHGRDDAGREIEKKNILGWMDPATVARRSLRHVNGKTVIYIPGLINKTLVRLISHMPRRLYYGMVGRIMA